MDTPPPTRPAGLPRLAGLFGFVAVIVSQSLNEGGSSSFSSVTAWAIFSALAALSTLLPWTPSLPAASGAGAWRVAAAGAVALAFVWVLFVLPNIQRNTAFLFTLGAAASCWAVWNAPGRPARR